MNREMKELLTVYIENNPVQVSGLFGEYMKSFRHHSVEKVENLTKTHEGYKIEFVAFCSDQEDDVCFSTNITIEDIFVWLWQRGNV